MRIGIITTQYAPNYGALLQAYSLQAFLKRNIKDCDVFDIDYWPTGTRDYWKIIINKKGFKDKLLNLYLLLHPLYYKSRKKWLHKMWKYRGDWIRLTREYHDAELLNKNLDAFDILLCGSDQIWNITRPEYSDVNFLSFASEWPNTRLISYAPSIAATIPDDQKEHIRKLLVPFDAISVREDVDVDQIAQLTQRDVEHVCDPVFLTSSSDWDRIIPERKIEEPYILCYFISTGKQAPQIVKKIQELTKLKVVHINVNARDKFNADYDIRTADPLEFVSYIKYADYVCTNSFHCTAFSIIYKRNLIVIRKQNANSRMESLLRKVGGLNSFVDLSDIDNISMESIKSQYDMDSLNNWIKSSKEYLLNAVLRDNNG